MKSDTETSNEKCSNKRGGDIVTIISVDSNILES